MINPFVTNDKSNEESKQNESIDKQNMSLMDEGISLLNSNRPKDAINKFKAYQSQNKESDIIDRKIFHLENRNKYKTGDKNAK